jgi:hypothetical protein
MNCTIASYDMVHCLLLDNGYELTIIWLFLWLKVYDVLWWALDPIIVLWPVHHTWMRGHDYGFASSVGHPRLDSDRLLVYDSMRTYQGYQCCITGPSRHYQPCKEGFNNLGRLSRIELWHMYNYSMIFPTLKCKYCLRNYSLVTIQN